MERKSNQVKSHFLQQQRREAGSATTTTGKGDEQSYWVHQLKASGEHRREALSDVSHGGEGENPAPG